MPAYDEDTTTNTFVARVVRDHEWGCIEEWALGLDGLADLSDKEIEFLATQAEQRRTDRELFDREAAAAGLLPLGRAA